MENYTLSLKKDGRYSVVSRELTREGFEEFYSELVELGYKVIGVF